jgi:hypothetical protein
VRAFTVSLVVVANLGRGDLADCAGLTRLWCLITDYITCYSMRAGLGGLHE